MRTSRGRRCAAARLRARVRADALDAPAREGLRVDRLVVLAGRVAAARLRALGRVHGEGEARRVHVVAERLHAAREALEVAAQLVRRRVARGGLLLPAVLRRARERPGHGECAKSAASASVRVCASCASGRARKRARAPARASRRPVPSTHVHVHARVARGGKARRDEAVGDALVERLTDAGRRLLVRAVVRRRLEVAAEDLPAHPPACVKGCGRGT